MSTWLIIAQVIFYTAIAISFLIEKHPGFALSFFCWGIGNLGILWEQHL